MYYEYSCSGLSLHYSEYLLGHFTDRYKFNCIPQSDGQASEWCKNEKHSNFRVLHSYTRIFRERSRKTTCLDKEEWNSIGHQIKQNSCLRILAMTCVPSQRARWSDDRWYKTSEARIEQKRKMSIGEAQPESDSELPSTVVLEIRSVVCFQKGISGKNWGREVGRGNVWAVLK